MIVAVMLILCIYSNWTPERIFPVCVRVLGRLCGCMWVRDTWELGPALHGAGGPSRLACVDWLVCEFFRGLLRGPHCSHACMTHGAVSVCLLVWPSAQFCTTASWCCPQKSYRAEFNAPWLCNTFIQCHSLLSIHLYATAL